MKQELFLSATVVGKWYEETIECIIKPYVWAKKWSSTKNIYKNGEKSATGRMQIHTLHYSNHNNFRKST